MRTRDFRDLIVWQKALRLTIASYAIARRLPAEERFALASQIRRAASGVGAAIAEGHSRPHRRDFLRFLAYAHASLKEVHHHLLLAMGVGYVSRHETRKALGLCEEISRMLGAMRRRLAEDVADR